MNCAEFEEIVHDLDRPGTEGFRARGAAFAHAESCDRCAQLLAQSEALDFALGTFSKQAGREQASPHLEALLLNEFRQRNASPSRRVLSWQIAALATAAALILALGLAIRQRAREKRPASATSVSGTESLRESKSNDVQGAVPQAAAVEHTVAPSVTPVVRERAVAASNNEVPDSESATPFVVLPYADDAMAGEGGAVVRVMLSRPALASLGMPVTDIGAGDRIPVDVMVSQDGAPQAIRLVAQADSE
jgi:hypothetical protein